MRCTFAGRSGPSYLSHQATPGPGDYAPERGRDNQLKPLPGAKPSAPFLSRAIRLETKKGVGPAPGAYESGHIPQYAPDVPSAAFTSGCSRSKEAEVRVRTSWNVPELECSG